MLPVLLLPVPLVVVLVPFVVLLVLPIDDDELFGEVVEFGVLLGLFVVLFIVPAAPVVSVVVPGTPAFGVAVLVPAAPVVSEVAPGVVAPVVVVPVVEPL